MKTYFTSESVTCGHPDKVCDQIADAVLDDILANDPDAHVACEVTACTGEVHLMGEISSSYVPDYEAIARKVIAEIGYTVPVVGFDDENVRIRVSIHTQSPDIARGVDRGAPEEAGAGDQGVGLMKYSVYSSSSSGGSTGKMTCSKIASRSASMPTSALCCAETTTAEMRLGLPSSYSTLTCALPSGRR